MAKNKVFIDVVVDDQGTTKRVAVNAKKLGIALDKTGESALTADRRMKGASQQSANGTKNFSKMAQGISGGLVPAYATLAAQVFAVSAAFQFLKSASEVRNLIAGQEALGAATGVAFKTITNSIKEATDGQISYTEAARAAAIGTAAGLNPTQLDKLGNAAKNASFALGRDLTDSFNRLIRGVTKAEPELLDELGITLRLADATEEYARVLNKPVKELTQLERTQAVANDVLEQAERKFGAIEKIMDPTAASLNQFLVSFESLINSIKVGAVGALTPIFDFLSQRTLSLTAALGLFALPIIKSILPSFDEWKDKSKETFDLQKEKIKELDAEYDGIRKTLKNLDADRDQALKNQQEDAARVTDQLGLKRGKEDGRAAADFLTGGATSRTAQVNADKVLKNAEKQIQQHGVVITGKLKGANAKQVADLRASYAQRVGILKGYEKQHASTYKKAILDVQLYAISAKKALAGLSGGIAAASGRVAGMVSGLFSLAGWIGIGLLLVDVFKQMAEALFPIDPALAALNSRAEEMAQELETLNSELAKTASVQASPNLLTLSERVVAVGNAFQSADLLNRFKELTSLQGADEFDSVNASLQTTVDHLATLNPEFAEAAKNVTDFTDSAQTDPLVALAQQSMNAGASTTALGQNLLDVEAQMRALGQVGGKALDPTVALMAALKKNAADSVVSLAAAEKQFESSQAAAKTAEETRADALERLDELNKQLPKAQAGAGFFSKGKALRDVEEQIALQTAILNTAEATIAQAEADEASITKARDAQSLNEERIAATQKLSERIVEINDEIMSNEREIAKEKTLGRNLDEQLVNFGLDRLASTNNVLAAEDALNRAKFRQNQLDKDADATVVAAAQTAVDNAEQAFTLAKDQNKVEQIKITLMEEQARLAEKIRLIQQQAMDEQTALARSQRLLDREAALSPTLLGSGAARRASTLVGKQQGVVSAQSNLAQAQAELSAAENPGVTAAGLQIPVDEAAVAAAEAQVRAKQEAVFLAQQELFLAQQLLKIKEASMLQEIEANNIRIVNFSLNPAENRFQEHKIELIKQGIVLTAEQEAAHRKVITVLYEQEIVLSNLNNISDTFRSSLEQGIQGMITGTTSLKDAFLNMAKAVLNALAQMIAQMLVMKLLQTAIFSSLDFGSLFGAAGAAGGGGGGVVNSYGMFGGFGPLRYGGVTDGYSRGGIAAGPDRGYPAVLHGTEAVVPLPNNRSIPVDLQGNAGGINNVTVNVTVGNDGQAQTNDMSATNDRASRLGKMISMAVQDELIAQKRPGGILSPYGAA